MTPEQTILVTSVLAQFGFTLRSSMPLGLYEALAYPGTTPHNVPGGPPVRGYWFRLQTPGQYCRSFVTEEALSARSLVSLFGAVLGVVRKNSHHYQA